MNKKTNELAKLFNIISDYILSNDVTLEDEDIDIAKELIDNAEKEIKVFKKNKKYLKLKKIFKNQTIDRVFISSYGIHHRDFDEMSYSMGGHPTATILPILLAFNIKNKKDYFLQALKLEIVLGKFFNPTLYNTKYHPTTIIGALGSTAISAKILNLSHKQTVNALGIVFSFFSGIKGNFGSDSKSIQVANATKNGLLASMLSKEGFNSNVELLEKTRALEIFIGKKSINIKKFKYILNNHISLKNEFLIKKYDVCGSFHDIIELALKDRQKYIKIIPNIKEIVLNIHPERLKNKNISLPNKSTEKKFSPRYLYAYAFLDKDLKKITKENTISKDILNTMKKISIYSNKKIGKWEYKTSIKIL